MVKDTKRCDVVVVQLVVTTYDEHGRPVHEEVSQPVKVFRARARDFWAEVDKAVKAGQQKPQPSPAPSPAPSAKGRRKR